MSKQMAVEYTKKLLHKTGAHALASEFIPKLPNTMASVNVCIAVAATNKSPVDLDKLRSEIEPIVTAKCQELTAMLKDRGIRVQALGSVMLSAVGFETAEKRAQFEEEILPIVVLETVLGDDLADAVQDSLGS